MLLRVVFFSITIFMLSSCIGQPAAPIEYNREAAKSKPIKPHIKPNLKPSINSRPVIENDENAITSREIKETEKEFEQPTGFLKEPTRADRALDLDKEDRIVVPTTIPENKKTISQEEEEGETLETNAQPIAGKNRPQVASNVMVLKKFVKPVEGKIISKFGEKTILGKNNGINIAADEGINVKAIAAGIVVYIGNDKQFGNLLIIKLNEPINGKHLYTAYAHLQELNLQKGDAVSEGETVGHVGQTGNVNYPQLHFAIREDKVAVDPLKYIPN